MYMIRGLILSLANAYTMVIFVYVIMSWLPNTTTGIVGDIYRILGKICDPYLNLFRRFIPPIGGVLDISPVVALLVLQFVVQFVVNIL